MRVLWSDPCGRVQGEQKYGFCQKKRLQHNWFAFEFPFAWFIVQSVYQRGWWFTATWRVSLLLAATYWLRPVLCVSNAAVWCVDMIRVAEGTAGRSTKPKPSQRSTLTSVLQYLGESHQGFIAAGLIFWQGRWEQHWLGLCCVVSESRPAPHVQRSHRTPGLQVQPPRRLLSSLPSHGPLGMLGKRSYHHSSRMDPERRANAPGQGADAKLICTNISVLSIQYNHVYLI